MLGGVVGGVVGRGGEGGVGSWGRVEFGEEGEGSWGFCHGGCKIGDAMMIGMP